MATMNFEDIDAILQKVDLPGRIRFTCGIIGRTFEVDVDQFRKNAAGVVEAIFLQDIAPNVHYSLTEGELQLALTRVDDGLEQNWKVNLQDHFTEDQRNLRTVEICR